VRTNSLLKTFRDGAIATASFVTVPDRFVAEVMASAGMDALIIDTAHSAMSLDQLQGVLTALYPGDSTVVVRVPTNDTTSIEQALDLGAEGVLVPGVHSAEDCRAAVRSSRYAPQGARGFGPRRASRLHGTRADYLARANDEIAVLVMIESVQGLKAASEIVQVPGLSGIFIGMADLAVSMGYMHDMAASAVQDAAREIGETAARYGVPYGVFTATPAAAEKWVSRGAQLVTLGSDLQYIDAGIAENRKARAVLLGHDDQDV
jgi:2-keto-3-deoxy-L-rhamnonate aldolase RhmA